MGYPTALADTGDPAAPVVLLCRHRDFPYRSPSCLHPSFQSYAHALFAFKQVAATTALARCGSTALRRSGCRPAAKRRVSSSAPPSTWWHAAKEERTRPTTSSRPASSVTPDGTTSAVLLRRRPIEATWRLGPPVASGILGSSGQPVRRHRPRLTVQSLQVLAVGHEASAAV